MYGRIAAVIGVGVAMIAAVASVRKHTPAPERATFLLNQPMASQANLPSPIVSLAMLRATFLAVDHGIKTGNFTVLRDLGSGKFRKANPAARLTQIFGTLPAQNVDLLATAITEPNFTRPPEMTNSDMIYMTGLFAIEPRPVAFEILFELEDNEWRLFAIAIAPAALQTPQQ